ncbi:MAG: hypothetical protein HY051_03255 [Candidatus Aenigmarchaeota archaeon]|nr:hypothetical protein [Candidatus Aenigmarchaeota archaeon]
MKNHQAFALSALVVSGIVFGYLVATFSFTPASLEDEGQSIKYTGVVCVYVNGKELQCDHNLFTNLGRNMTKDLLGIAGPLANVTYIGISNTTATQAAADVVLQGEYAVCGFGRTSALYNTNIISVGNWTLTREFTSSCDSMPINGTGLYNSSSGSFLFAENTFTTATLQTNDKINITWFIWVV